MTGRQIRAEGAEGNAARLRAMVAEALNDAEVVYALWRRDMLKFLRDRRSLVTSLTRPFLWLLAFGFGLRASVSCPAGGPTTSRSWCPGIAAMTVLFSSMFAAISIVWEREFGFLKELLVAPVPRGAIVAAKLLAGSATALFEVSLMLPLSPLFGARFSPPARWPRCRCWPCSGWPSTRWDRRGGADEVVRGFGRVVNFVIQPIFFLSGALYPIDGLPRALRAVVLVNPMSYAGRRRPRALHRPARISRSSLDVGGGAASAVVFGALATPRVRRMEV